MKFEYDEQLFHYQVKIMGHQEVIALFTEALCGIELPACITLCDNEGLILFSVGNCLGDDLQAQNLYAYLIMTYDAAVTNLKTVKEEADNILISSKDDHAFFVDCIDEETGVFLLVKAKQGMMTKVLPFLNSIIKKMEILLKSDEG